MASNSSESTPLLPAQRQQQQQPGGASAQSSASPARRPARTVTFNPTVSTSSAAPSPPSTSASTTPQSRTATASTATQGGQPVLSALNSKLRRRHSHSASTPTSGPPLPRAGAQRTTKNAQKLKLLPNPDQADGGGEDNEDYESGREVYSQFTRIKDPNARRDAARLGKDDREKLPRVTAYCTASSYKLDEMMKFLKGRGKARGAAPKLFDECIYSPYSYGSTTLKTWDGARMDEFAVDGQSQQSLAQTGRRYSDSAVEVDSGAGETPENTAREDLLDMHVEGPGTLSLDNGEEAIANHTATEMQQPQEPRQDTLDFDTQVHTPEVFLFNYGTVVIWGMTVKEEQKFLKDIAKFETEKLDKDDVQTENFNFYYTREYQARIYNDFISLREKRNYMTKLAISHALSQSVKTSLYEDLVDNTIDTTKDVPAQIATTGKVNLSRKEINMQIGELFILRINIHLQGSVLDSPELMWAEPQLDPVYQAVRSYLEMDQRVSLLTERLDVIADLLAVLKDQLAHGHSETLEVIVIVLIAMEIVVAAVNIIVDLYAGVD